MDRHKVAWSQAGTGDHQIGKDYVDEKLDGKKKVPEVEGDIDSVVWKWVQEMAENNRLRERIEELEATAGPGVNVQKERWMGMLLLNGEPTKGAINQAFKKQAKRWHPDQGGDAEVFKQLQEAKTQLLKIC